MNQKTSSNRIKSRNNRTLLIILLISAALIVALLSFMGVRQVALALASTPNDENPLNPEGADVPILDEEGNPIPAADTAPIAPSTNPWDGAGRVTILVMGLDYRDWSADEGPSRSDTMILLTLDPLSKTAGMLSIPRDMWVSIPGFQHGKINTAYYLGDAHQLPGGGPALAVKTVEQFLGVPINYYAQIDFGAFVRFIDEIGGVKIDVPEQITIDLLGSGFETKKKLKPGIQVLPGEWALAYARARYTEGGDFDRAQRQQQVIMAIRNQILSFDLLPTLMTKAPVLYKELASGINTNLSLDEVIKLALLAVDISDEDIQRGIIDESNVLFGNSPDGLSILIPIPDDIHLLRDQIFAASDGLGPETPGDAHQQMGAEGARISIYNGSSTPGLAERTADYLRSQGANIVQVGNANQSYTSTTVIDYSGSPYALKYLVDLIGISQGRIYNRFDPSSAVDVELYLGDDWANQNSLP
jgi:LCP family protein required for cell wall assembly